MTIVVAPENIDRFLEYLKPCFEAVVAEPECAAFEVFHDPEQPGCFRFVENWRRDKEWLIKVSLDFFLRFFLGFFFQFTISPLQAEAGSEGYRMHGQDLALVGWHHYIYKPALPSHEGRACAWDRGKL